VVLSNTGQNVLNHALKPTIWRQVGIFLGASIDKDRRHLRLTVTRFGPTHRCKSRVRKVAAVASAAWSKELPFGTTVDPTAVIKVTCEFASGCPSLSSGIIELFDSVGSDVPGIIPFGESRSKQTTQLPSTVCQIGLTESRRRKLPK
jgi:hypothetical protein